MLSGLNSMPTQRCASGPARAARAAINAAEHSPLCGLPWALRGTVAEYRDMKHDLFVPQGGEVLLLESGASAETLLLEN
jgi:hypothetical protein